MHNISVPIIIDEKNGIERKAEPVTIGVPFQKGKLFSVNELFLDDNNEPCPVQIMPTSYWHDNSIKWVLVQFQTNLSAGESKKLYLKEVPATHKPAPKSYDAVSINKNQNHIFVNTGSSQFAVNKHQLAMPLVLDKQASRLIQEYSAIQFKDQNNKVLNHKITDIDINCPDNAISATIRIRGLFENEKNSQPPLALKFFAKLTFYAGQSRVKWSIGIHNPNRARHEQGFWDLGDPGSILFKDLSLVIKTDNTPVSEISWKPTAKSAWEKVDKRAWYVFQSSSGGDNWQSTNHVNRDGKVTLPFKGAKYTDIHGEEHYQDRLSPFLFVQAKEQSLVLHMKNFWQNFPKAICVSKSQIKLSFFPELSGDLFELQAGEKKTHHIFLDYSDDTGALDFCAAPLVPVIPLDYYSQCDVLPFLPPEYNPTSLDRLIQESIDGNNNIYHKRETIDEYGWRHFGDLFADHESLYNHEGHYFVSHYNNQYDALSGFIRQFIITGNEQWYPVMSELAEHITDIDIYDTDEDRHEYNHGLFWHTNHYVDALTSTHRTFSKGHITASEPNPGGGPGNEHCYSRGLMQHYFLTGSQASRNASLKMTDWMIKLHEGNNGFLERLLKFVQNELPVIKKKLRGNRQVFYRYPLNRGTGNYINSLLDAYELTTESSYLNKAEQVIYQTLHPDDDISHRNLEDPEDMARWSYTIVLQSIIAYLRIKATREELDEAFCYARDCLKHYTLWMLENEYPYLEKPDILEFPNDTWTAQDLRKAYIFSITSTLFDNPVKQQLQEKAAFYMSYVVNKLNKTETRTFTRIQVILMQNHIDLQHNRLFASRDLEEQARVTTVQHKPVINKSVKQMVFQLILDMLKRLFCISPTREYHWFRSRFL